MLYFLLSYISKKIILCLGTEMVFTKFLDHNFLFQNSEHVFILFLAFVIEKKRHDNLRGFLLYSL